MIAFERFTDIGGIYPLAVSVSVDGRELASIPIAPPAAGETPMITKAIDLPDDLAGPGVRDVLLRSSSWVHAKTSGLGRLISIRVASIALEGDPAAHSALPASSR